MSLKVLLADDSVPAQNMGKKILVDAGYEVLTASNGLEALRKIAEAPPDIVILDIFMPGYSGLEICSRLRSATPTSTLPVILTVGKMEPYRAEDGEEVHSNAVVVKPFAATELISAVRSLIGESGAKVQPPTGAESPLQESNQDPLQAAPLQESHSATMPSESPVPAPGEALASEPLEEASHGDPLSDGVEASGPESLAYNPESVHTPFRASAMESLPEFPTVDSESPFGEFDLLAQPSSSPADPEPEISSIDEPLFAAPESDETPLQTATPGEASQTSIAQAEAVHADADTITAPAQIVSDAESRTPGSEDELHSSAESSPLDGLPAEVSSNEPPPAEAKSIDLESLELSSMGNRSRYSPFGVQLDLDNEPLTTNSQAEFIASTLDLPQSSGTRTEPEPIITGEISEVLLQEEAESNWSAIEPNAPDAPAVGSAAIPDAPAVGSAAIPDAPAVGSAAIPDAPAVGSAAIPDAPAVGSAAIPDAPAVGSAAIPDAPAVGSAAIPDAPAVGSAAIPEIPEASLPELLAEPEPLAAIAPPETHEDVLEPVQAVADAVQEVAAPEPFAAEAQVAQPLPEMVSTDVEPTIAPEAKAVELEPEPVPVQIEPKTSEAMELTQELVQAPAVPEVVAGVPDSAMEAHTEKISSAPEEEQKSLSQQTQSQQFLDKLSDEEIIRVAVDRVFDRFKGLLVKAILRELKAPE